MESREQKSETKKVGLSDVDLSKAHAAVDRLVTEIEKVIVGKHEQVVLLVTAMLAGGHVLIEDIPGVGKTTLAATLAKAAGLSFRRAQFTPDITPSDITGFNLYNRREERFIFSEGLVMTNILLADEINRASPKTQAALLESMEEGRVTVDGQTYPLPEPFMVIATENPGGFVGTFPLPEAQLDRFSLCFSMGYPAMEEEISFVSARKRTDPMETVRPILSDTTVRLLRQLAEDVHIEESLFRYLVTLIRATRERTEFSLGASPRASLTLMRICRAYAFLKGREYVIPEDIAAVFLPTVGHRVMLSKEAKLNQVKPEQVLKAILDTTPVPYRHA